MFITHLLNSLPQSEYKGAILVIKDKLGKADVELSEIEQNLEDKYQAMKHVKGWDKRKMIMASSQANPIRKSPRKHFKDIVGTVENLDIRQQVVPTRNATKIRAQKAKVSTKRNTVLKETIKEKDIGICQKLSVLIVVNMDIMHKIVHKHVIMLV